MVPTTATTSQALLLSSLTCFFKRHPNHRRKLRELIEGGSRLSLRVIDWVLTHYARRRTVVYWIDDAKCAMYETFPAAPEGGPHLRRFDLYNEYRAQLKSYTKMYFDSFRRHERITFVLEAQPKVAVDTTAGQLNLFRWAFQNHVVAYIETHLEDIEREMARFQRSKTAVPVPEPSGAGPLPPAPLFIRFD